MWQQQLAVTMYSRDSVGIAAETGTWSTSASSVTSPPRRRYDNSPRDVNKHHHVTSNYSVIGRDTQPVSRAGLSVSSDMVDSMLRARRLDLAAAAAAADDDDDDAGARRHNDVRRTAVRPWLMHPNH